MYGREYQLKGDQTTFIKNLLGEYTILKAARIILENGDFRKVSSKHMDMLKSMFLSPKPKVIALVDCFPETIIKNIITGIVNKSYATELRTLKKTINTMLKMDRIPTSQELKKSFCKTKDDELFSKLKILYHFPANKERLKKVVEIVNQMILKPTKGNPRFQFAGEGSRGRENSVQESVGVTENLVDEGKGFGA